MTTPLLIFAVPVALLIFMLAWAVRPPKKPFHSVDQVLGALTEKRHYARLPQILQSLREEDTEFLCTGGHGELAKRLKRQRKQIALGYLDSLEQEYQLLLEASRILAKTAPEVSPIDELERLRLSLRFVLSCRYLRWRLRLGLEPWDLFGNVSDMAGEMTLRLELAAGRIGEQAAAAAEFPLLLEHRGRSTD